MFSQLFVAAFLAVSAQTALSADCARSYTVQEGDYCDKISQAQNVSTYQLAVLNSDAVNTQCSNLIVGQNLCLANKPEEDCSTTYTVLPSDTCADIASKNALNTTILFLNNPQIDEACSNIYTGEVLCTSKSVQVAPVPATGVTVVAPQTTIIVKPTTTADSGAIAAPTPVPAAAPTQAADNGACGADNCDDDSAANTTPDAVDDGDDDNLPFCDEL